MWGEALVATTDGVFLPNESRLFPRGQSTKRHGYQLFRALRRLVPEVVITAYKDIKLKTSKPKTWPIENEVYWKGKQVMMVWERHDLFPGPGQRLARKLGVPFVISVEALAVWEAAKWGVRRPFWGQWLERHVEAESLKKADLVVCVSDEVRKKVIDLGVASQRVLVCPNRVDSTIFFNGVDCSETIKTYGLQGKRVIGWTGSFRAFHGLDTVISAFKDVCSRFEDAVLMLVGDGQELDSIRQKAIQVGIEHAVIFPGRQPFVEIPRFIGCFHIGIVSASSARDFHYSPLKLREYLATGCAVIAPKAGDLPELFKDGQDLLFYEAGMASDLAEKITQILNDSNLHQRLVEKSLDMARKEGAWIHELSRVTRALEPNGKRFDTL